MMNQTPSLSFACPEYFYWVRDVNFVLIVNDHTSDTYILQDKDAAIWDWLSLSYSYQKIVRLLASLTTLSSDDAEQILLYTLQNWNQIGLMEIIEETTRD